MAKKTVGRTALGAASCRFMEQFEPKPTRLFDDPLAGALIGGPVRLMFQLAALRRFTIQQMDAITAGIYGSQICRTRFIDDAVREALSHGIDQLVILGAGFDTRPYRLPGMERVKVYEVDLPAVQYEKKKRLQKYLGHLPESVTFIPIDFDRQTLDSAFSGTGFDPARPAVFVWEAVTQYITEEAVQRTLSYVGQSAAGSVLVFTYVLKSIIERRSDIPGADRMMDFVANDSPWLCGLDPSTLQEYLQPFGLNLVSDVGNSFYQERYLKPLGRTLEVTEGERVAQAVVV